MECPQMSRFTVVLADPYFCIEDDICTFIGQREGTRKRPTTGLGYCDCREPGLTRILCVCLTTLEVHLGAGFPSVNELRKVHHTSGVREK